MPWSLTALALAVVAFAGCTDEVVAPAEDSIPSESRSEAAIAPTPEPGVVELRYFGGLTLEETAKVLDVSVVTVKRDWTTARARLYREVRESLARRQEALVSRATRHDLARVVPHARRRRCRSPVLSF